ncbi:(RS)-norcoclaurine 6-O-methyltransferase-like [Pyrus ussuriensis x Pyrus communis]|uniref:(RS)-norcoclaurine 6-O-methyltransferase-like n=1 Tax=Pyrus ussuriensis x Pyrus communis TaxID=2448454 RepID=A0A5N5FHM1_9ROSA|nr:(RS)-norcoclaurine 6-O-methyltransferase-like [Pyrus ussuriensis x Pyrus communis]
MEEKRRELTWEEEEEHAKVDVWKHLLKSRCHGSPMTLLELSSALSCDPSHLYRLMRALVHRKIFKDLNTTQKGSSGYAQTPSIQRLRKYKDLWSFSATNPDHSKLFNDAMTCDAKVVVPAEIKSCKGLETIVGVGGGNGILLRLLVEVCPWIWGINFDLSHVVSVSPECDRVENVAGDMFDCVPKADAVITKGVLHDWGDDDCIRILKKCPEAVPKDTGKVIIIDAKLANVKLMLDVVMIVDTKKGKERSLEEWEYILGEADFTGHTITHVHAIQYFGIQAFS